MAVSPCLQSTHELLIDPPTSLTMGEDPSGTIVAHLTQVGVVKLGGMGQVIHDHAGLWIAPAAPGFAARLIGGTRNVDRKDGATLGVEMTAASARSPDAIGLISWNEFSENSFVEPSRDLGSCYMDVLTAILSTGSCQPATDPGPGTSAPTSP